MQHMKTRVMGILNVTPDSCYDGGRYNNPERAVERARLMLAQGADIIDIGAESSRPGAAAVAEDEELRRLLPCLQAIRAAVDLPLSVDTYKWRVAQRAIELGVTFINDITGLRDPSMRKVAADSGVEVCVMHMLGEPRTMQEAPYYPEGIIVHLMGWFARRVDQLLKDGIAPDKIYLDPGIGFGKTVADNVEILHNLHMLQGLGFPLLLGLSRKSFMGKINGKGYESLLPETLAANTIACRAGAAILRVHDVDANRAICDLLAAFSSILAPPPALKAQ